MASLRNPQAPSGYFKSIKFVLKLVGVALEGNESISYKCYSFALLFFFDIMYLVLYSMEALKRDFGYVIDTMLLYLSGVTLATIKVIVVLRNRLQFKKLLDKLEQEPFTANLNRGGELEEKLIKKCVWTTNVQTLAYWIISYACILGGSTFAFSSRLRSDDYNDWVFAYGPLTVLNVTHSSNYKISFAYQTASMSILGTHFMCIDLIVAAVLAHVSCQFKILQNNMRRLVQISYEKMLKETGPTNLLQANNLSIGEEIDGSTIPWKYLKQSLQGAINYHLAIINIANEIETVFSDLLLMIFLFTLVMLCITIFQVAVSLNEPNFAEKVSEMLSTVLQVATVCYWGQQVIDESQEVGRAAYETNFVGTDLRFQKSLVLIIRRSQNPIAVTAGKFTAVNLPIFAWIIRTSYSAFMMLVRMRETNRTLFEAKVKVTKFLLDLNITFGLLQSVTSQTLHEQTRLDTFCYSTTI